MPPRQREKPAPPQNRLSPERIANRYSIAIVQGLHRRRAASRRIVGGDPWWYEPPVAGYEDAAAHLLGLGLTPAPNVAALRAMWKTRGESQRLAWLISERWDLIA